MIRYIFCYYPFTIFERTACFWGWRFSLFVFKLFKSTLPSDFFKLFGIFLAAASASFLLK